MMMRGKYKHIFTGLFMITSYTSIFLFGCTTSSEPPERQVIWKPDATSDFEVGTQIRAWTIRDEGMSTILDNMQSMAGINNVMW